MIEPLCAIVDIQVAKQAGWTAGDLTKAYLNAGARFLQVRGGNCETGHLLRLCDEMVKIGERYGARIIVNDRFDIAKLCGAAGVHLGQSDGSLALARRQLGDHAIVGATCHADLALASRADADGADYLAFGRFFNSTTKPDAPVAEPSVLTKSRQFGKPVTAIGGITIDNGEGLIRAGADLLAVVGGLFDGDVATIEERARRFSQLFAQHHPLFSSSVSQES